ncbi:MAG: hypothetical protein U0892_07505 [Pirellulales bacterium]
MKRPPARCRFSIVRSPIVGTSNRMSCCGLATLINPNPPRGQMSPVRSMRHPFPDGFDTQDGPVANRYALTDIQPSHFSGDGKCKVDVLQFAHGRFVSSQRTFLNQQLRGRLAYLQDMKAALFN